MQLSEYNFVSVSKNRLLKILFQGNNSPTTSQRISDNILSVPCKQYIIQPDCKNLKDEKVNYRPTGTDPDLGKC
jgi:hypothetical protein